MSRHILDTKIEDSLIVLIGAKNVPVTDLFRLHVMMSGAIRALKLGRRCIFVRTKDGPRCKIIDEKLDQLEQEGLITLNGKISLTKEGEKRQKDILTPKNGETPELLKSLYKDMYAPPTFAINIVKNNYNDATEDEIYVLIHRRNPKLITKSDVDKRIPDMKKAFINLAIRGKISTGYLADALNIDYLDAYKIMDKHGCYYGRKNRISA